MADDAHGPLPSSTYGGQRVLFLTPDEIPAATDFQSRMDGDALPSVFGPTLERLVRALTEARLIQVENQRVRFLAPRAYVLFVPIKERRPYLLNEEQAAFIRAFQKQASLTTETWSIKRICAFCEDWAVARGTPLPFGKSSLRHMVSNYLAQYPSQGSGLIWITHTGREIHHYTSVPGFEAFELITRRSPTKQRSRPVAGPSAHTEPRDAAPEATPGPTLDWPGLRAQLAAKHADNLRLSVVHSERLLELMVGIDLLWSKHQELLQAKDHLTGSLPSFEGEALTVLREKLRQIETEAYRVEGHLRGLFLQAQAHEARLDELRAANKHLEHALRLLREDESTG